MGCIVFESLCIAILGVESVWLRRQDKPFSVMVCSAKLFRDGVELKWIFIFKYQLFFSAILRIIIGNTRPDLSHMEGVVAAVLV